MQGQVVGMNMGSGKDRFYAIPVEEIRRVIADSDGSCRKLPL
jgi:hypothetical protein